MKCLVIVLLILTAIESNASAQVKVCKCGNLESSPSPVKANEENNDNSKLYLVSHPTRFWTNGITLNVAFMNGSPAAQQKVIGIAKEWSNHGNISFKVTDVVKSHIRIRFDPSDGHWSYIGKDALSIKLDQPTMNIGLTAKDSDETFNRVVLHEFGHALGFTHEQFSGSADIPWNKAKVYEFYQGAPNFWDKDQIDHNILNAKGTPITNYDKESIMHYAVPNALTNGDFEIPLNKKLSSADKAGVRSVYPKPNPKSLKTALVYRGINDELAMGPVELNYGFSSSDPLRGWNWRNNVATYIAFDGKATYFYSRSFDGKNFGNDIKKVRFAFNDSIRGWSWDGKNASYIVAVDGKCFLYVRSFDGKKFGPAGKPVLISSTDSIRSWDWHPSKNIAYYAHWDGKRSAIYKRGFNGKVFDSSIKQRVVSTMPDSWRGLSIDGSRVSYAAAIPK